MKESFCPECDFRLKLGGRPFKGQRITCPECETRLIVTDLHPIELDVANGGKVAVYTKHNDPMLECPCPVCEEPIKLTPPAHKGQAIVCKTCFTSLEVTQVDPLELDLALGPPLKETRAKKGDPDKSRRKKLSQDWD